MTVNNPDSLNQLNQLNDLKSVKNLCNYCKKRKVALIPFSCKCLYKSLCNFCRLPEDHKCTFDYKTEGKNILRENNPLIVNSKVTLI